MIRAILIDDEERARRVLTNLLTQFCPKVEILKVCNNVPDAVLAINKLQPDVVFTDIEMPGYSGFELLDFFKNVDFEIIFTTGYHEYALKAFQVSAIDYLLKPIQIDQLENAVRKLMDKKNANMHKRLETLKENLKQTEIHKIALPTFDGLLFVDVDDIVCIEADGAYTNVSTKAKKPIMVSKRLKYFELLLENRNQFFRVHRSTIININFIEKYSKAESYLSLQNLKKIKISRDKKSDFEAHISDIRL